MPRTPGPPGSGPLPRLLRAERERLGLRQQELAERAGVSPAYLSRLEAGKGGMRTPSVPSHDVCVRLARALGIDPARVLIAAGYLTEEQRAILAARSTVPQAIMEAQELTSEQRQWLLDAYRLLTNGMEPPPRSDAPGRSGPR